MAFKKIDIWEQIEEKIRTDEEFAKAWVCKENEKEIIRGIVSLRNELGLTQKQLAEKVGACQQIISRIENGEHSPQLATVCSLLNSMGCELVIQKKASV